MPLSLAVVVNVDSVGGPNVLEKSCSPKKHILECC